MRKSSVPVLATIALVVGAVAPALGQLIDRTLAPTPRTRGSPSRSSSRSGRAAVTP